MFLKNTSITLRYFSHALFSGLLLFGVFLFPLHAQMGGGMGGGMMGGTGSGGMGLGTSAHISIMGTGMGAIMLVSGDQPFHSDGTILSISDAITIARQYLSTRKETNLALDEIEEYEYNFYVVVKETDSNNKAFQLIIDKWTGLVMPEPGPNMMWNTKYFEGGTSRSEVMSGFAHSSSTMTVTPDAAATTANTFLAARFSPARRLAVVTPPDTFYGYYNFDVNDVATGMKYGMLSVNGSTGQVWYHTWHGNFIQGQEITN